MKIEACIFDLDGVIVDSAKHHFRAWKEMANSLGIDFTEKDNQNLKGVSRMDSLDYILSLKNITKSDKEKEQLAYNKNEMYLSLVDQMTQKDVLPGVVSFINELKAKGYKIALGSASKNAVRILENLELIDLFEVIIDGTKTTKGKPDPQVFQLGAEALKVEAAKIIVFEDAQKGVAAALNGGFKCIGVGEWENLMHADYVIKGFENFTIQDIEERIY